jgi:NAD(P)-dependent dehydrogenase (short-subunit alcohol dehydrogenase family)
MTQIRGSVAIVTGASRGVGRAIALALAGRHANLVLVARNQDALERVAIAVRESGGEAEIVPGDIRDEATAAAAVERAQAAYGRLDTLVNNAGVESGGPVESLSLEAWRACLDTNLTAAFLFSRAAIPAMKRQGAGHILMISSGAGKQGYGNMSAYSASKFGLMGFAQALAHEVGDDHIKVCTVVPGSIVTDFSGHAPRPGGKYLLPQDVAQAILFLLDQSDRAWTQEMSVWPFREYTAK